MRNFATRSLVLLVGLLFPSVPACPQADVQAVTDQTSYQGGSMMRLQLSFSDSATALRSSDFFVTLRYAGESRPILESLPLPATFNPAGAERSTGYHDFWKIPLDAKTGRYEIDLVARDRKSRRALWEAEHTAWFAVYRKRARIAAIELDKTFYTSGDAVACTVKVTNLTGQTLRDLRVEFSDRYWPWIAQSAERAGVDVVTIAKALTLPPDAERTIRSERAEVAREVTQPTVHQYAVVVWGGERKEVFDIAFSQLVFIRPQGSSSAKPYPSQYLYPRLENLDASTYRHFYPPALESSSIEFDRSHTMFNAGSSGEVGFSVVNATAQPWRSVSIRVRWLDSDGKEVSRQTVVQAVDLAPGASPLKAAAPFTFPAQAAGLFRVEAEVSEPAGQPIAVNRLEVGVVPLPKSILIFCAHEDDEMAHAGIIRAAVESHVPIHVVYFTSGDSGSCDRYYQHSCSPAEALDFGTLRMEEARASLGHLGVARENIYFLGLPDGGSGEIWWNHPDAAKPYLAVLLATDHAPYGGLAHPNLPYARRAVVDAAKDFIKKFQPDAIYTGHPDERHVDHRTNNWFVVKALQELLREGALPSLPSLLVDQVYGPGPQTPAPYHYQKQVVSVSGEVMALAQEAQWFYQSQSGNRAQVHFKTFDQLPRSESHWQVLDWKDHEGWNEAR